MCSVRVAAVQSCGNARLILYRGLKSEESLTIDSIFLGVRFDYVAKVIGLGENDFAALREFHSVIEPHLETIVKRVYQKIFDFDWMKRHFVPKHHGFEGNAPESVDNWSAPIFCTRGYESTGWLKFVVLFRQCSVEGAPATETEHCRANSDGGT